MMNSLKTILCLFLLLISLAVAEPSVEFFPVTLASLPSKAEMDLFQGDDCDLTWLARSLPGTEITLQAEVFQAATAMALPLKDLHFELKSRIGAEQISTELKHRLALPISERPLIFWVKWQTKTNGESTQKGNVLIRTFPRGLLSDWPHVMISEQAELNPIHDAFTKEHVEISRSLKPQGANWKGTFFLLAKGDELEKLQRAPLSQDQCIVVFADLPGLIGSSLVKSLGTGRLVVLPISWLSRFQTSPMLQKTTRDFALSLR
jgi:hypothetical protein